MIDRILQEVKLLQKQYGVVENDSDGKWVLIKNYQLPKGWNKDQTDILINIPAGYPATPPNNFFVPVGLRLTNGANINAYTEPHLHWNKDWGQFSYHSDGDWIPSKDMLDGDTLLTFMLSVQKRLSETN